MAGEEGTSKSGMDYGKMKEMDVKMLVEAEHKKKKMGGHKHYWRIGVKRQTNTKWERNQWLRMAMK